ncbi:hypothetical protein ACSBR1_028631 [Camellia fascicularis]
MLFSHFQHQSWAPTPLYQSKPYGAPCVYTPRILNNHPGPWGRRYTELGPSVKILGSLELTELSEFYKALDVFVNPTLRPHGLDLTLIEPMHCGKPVLVPNFPSIMGTLVLNEGFGYTFSPNVKSFVEALESAIRDGIEVLKRKGLNYRYCQYPRPTNC